MLVFLFLVALKYLKVHEQFQICNDFKSLQSKAVLNASVEVFKGNLTNQNALS